MGLVADNLGVKLQRRKHMAATPCGIRVCVICEAFRVDSPQLHVPQLFCRVRSLWPAILKPGNIICCWAERARG